MVDSASSEVKLDFSRELKEQIQKNLELQAKLDDSEKRHRSKDTQLSDLRKKLGEASAPKPAAEPEPTPAPAQEPTPPPQPELPPHAMSITDAYCPTCSAPNEKFKNETWCKDCGHPLGAKETLKDVKNCPGCKAEGKIAKTTPPPTVKFDEDSKEWKVVKVAQK